MLHIGGAKQNKDDTFEADDSERQNFAGGGRERVRLRSSP
jgi:hypothetical protein